MFVYSVKKRLVLLNVLLGLFLLVSNFAHATAQLIYTEGGYTFTLPSNVPYFARGVGTFPSGNGSVLNNATNSVIAYCPSCGTLGVLTITNNSNSTFSLTSFNLGGFSPPAWGQVRKLL